MLEHQALYLSCPLLCTVYRRLACFISSLSVRDSVSVLVHPNLSVAKPIVRDSYQGPLWCRYAGWAKGQLADECARNVWYPVSCSTSLLLPRIPKNQKHSPDMWHDIMELIGGAHSLLVESRTRERYPFDSCDAFFFCLLRSFQAARPTHSVHKLSQPV